MLDTAMRMDDAAMRMHMRVSLFVPVGVREMTMLIVRMRVKMTNFAQVFMAMHGLGFPFTQDGSQSADE